MAESRRAISDTTSATLLKHRNGNGRDSARSELTGRKYLRACIGLNASTKRLFGREERMMGYRPEQNVDGILRDCWRVATLT